MCTRLRECWKDVQYNSYIRGNVSYMHIQMGVLKVCVEVWLAYWFVG